jgi:predicted nucleic acid-binding protein
VHKHVYCDTNVVLDLLVGRREGHDEALRFLQTLVLQDSVPTISEDMLSTIYYIAPDKHKALMFFRQIRQDWHIVPFGGMLIDEAIERALESGADLEDILQCLAAREAGCQSLVTNDATFYRCGIEILSPKEYVERHHD